MDTWTRRHEHWVSMTHEMRLLRLPQLLLLPHLPPNPRFQLFLSGPSDDPPLSKKNIRFG